MQKVEKVIHIIVDLGNGGAERQLIELLKRNPKHKLLIYKNAGIYKNELDKNKIKYKELNLKNINSIFSNLLKISEEIKFSKATIIHSWMYNACLTTAIVKLLFNLSQSLVWGIRCSDMDLRHYSFGLRLTVKLTRLLSFLPNLIIYNSQAGFNYHKNIGYSSKSYKVIYNGIDNKKFKFSAKSRIVIRKQLGIKKNEIVIICAARVDPMKNHQSLLQAFKKIKRTNKKCILLLIGKGTEDISNKEGVISVGMKINIEDYYSAGDIIIMSSRFGEGFPNALAEGMLCKLFPVTTNVGDAKTLVSEIGLVAKSTEYTAIYNALKKALEMNKNKINKLKENSRLRVVKEVTLKKMSAEYQKSYKELV